MLKLGQIISVHTCSQYRSDGLTISMLTVAELLTTYNKLMYHTSPVCDHNIDLLLLYM